MLQSWQAGAPYDAVQAFRDLQKSGLTPNVITWSSVISSLCKQRRKGAPFAHLAYELWRELDASGLATGNAALYAAGGGSTISLSHVADLHRKVLKADFCLAFVCFKTQWSDSVVWCAGMNACVGLGYVDEAAELLRTMQKSGMRADVRAYNILLKGQANARSLSSMQATMSDMERMQVAPSVVTYNILIDAFANEGLLEQVMLTVATPCAAPHL